jgi:hypothetical protein
MVAASGSSIITAYGRHCCSIGKINGPALHLGFTLQLGVVLNDAFHRLEHAGKGLLEVIGEHKHFIRCFLSESPRQGQSAVKRGLAALLDARIDDCVPWKPVVIIEGKGESQHFALMVAEAEGLA